MTGVARATGPVAARMRERRPAPRFLERAMRALACSIACFVAAFGAHADPTKILRVAVFDIDTLDPQQYSDHPSFSVIQALFEPAFEWDYLSRTPKLTPLTAAAPARIDDAGRTWTIRLKRGIRFVDDPAFLGKPRELVAEDYVYAYKRWLDPNLRRGGQPVLTDLIVGARPVVDAAKRSGRLDYDAPIEGLRALDRHTLRIRLREPNFPAVEDMLGMVGAVAREVVEAAGGDIRERPVGTGPYRLREWKRGSRLLLVANPDYREAGFPASTDPGDAALVASMRGRRVPFAGAVEVHVIDEDATRLLAFERGDLDFIELRGEIATRLLAGGDLAPAVAARGVTRQVHVEPFLFSFYFNMKDPVLGGTSREKVALRRAIAMGFDTERFTRVVMAGQAIPASQIAPPGTTGHDPAFASASMHDPAAANALLDRFGYGTRDPDGYRRGPDGRPLTITLSLRTGGISRDLQTLWRSNLHALGLRAAFETAPFQEIIRNVELGRFQMYHGGYGGSPSGYNEFAQLHGVEPQRVNVVGFADADYDRAAAAFLRAADETGRIEAARTMNAVARAYMPMLPAYFRLESAYVQPWLAGFRPQRFSTYWKYLDVDTAKRR